MEYWRRSCRISRIDKVTNEEIRQRMGVKKDTLTLIEDKRLVWYGHPVFVPIDPSIVELILTTDFEHFTAHFEEFHHQNILSANLINMQGEPWRQLRRKLTPVFSSSKLRMMFEVVVEKADDLAALVDREVDQDSVDIKDVSASTDTKSLLQVVPEALAGESSRVSADAKVLQDFFTGIVKDTIEYREKNNIFKKDFMHLMIHLKNRGYLSADRKLLKTEEGMGADSLTEFEVADQCLFSFLAGYETSATTMAYAIYELTQNPEAQVKIREEVDRVLRNHGGKLTYDAVAVMKCTERVIQGLIQRLPKQS
ncbi:probable cytochrome P450 6a20 [Cylas formicarius]|uniref:probable cytochrome P450 6a20 n=1 Tax=Cylas formicarius TaxID=197179 RepID=UPI002958BD4A|nr:probable cytochrome P450 6a20 [Cylas formicarius]